MLSGVRGAKHPIHLEERAASKDLSMTCHRKIYKGNFTQFEPCPKTLFPLIAMLLTIGKQKFPFRSETKEEFRGTTLIDGFEL
jgi:hypothetical protein